MCHYYLLSPLTCKTAVTNHWRDSTFSPKIHVLLLLFHVLVWDLPCGFGQGAMRVHGGEDLVPLCNSLPCPQKSWRPSMPYGTTMRWKTAGLPNLDFA